MYRGYEKPFIFLGNPKAIDIWEHARKSQPARDKTFLAGRDLHVHYRISIENGRGTSLGSASVQEIQSEKSLHSFPVFLPLHWKMIEMGNDKNLHSRILKALNKIWITGDVLP